MDNASPWEAVFYLGWGVWTYNFYIGPWAEARFAVPTKPMVYVDVKQHSTKGEVHGLRRARKPVWPSGKAVGWKAEGPRFVRIRFGSPFSSKVAVCGHCLVTLSLTINETPKWL